MLMASLHIGNLVIIQQVLGTSKAAFSAFWKQQGRGEEGNLGHCSAHEILVAHPFAFAVTSTAGIDLSQGCISKFHHAPSPHPRLCDPGSVWGMLGE